MPTQKTKKQLDSFFESFAGATTPLLMLDYDGTLAPFRVDRYRARPWGGVRELLVRIQRQGQTRIVIITGRPAGEIAPLLGMERAPEVWGLHGAERLLPDGRHKLKHAPPRARAKLGELHKRLRRDALGGLFEEKSNAAVMHWRGVPAKKAQLIEQKTRELFEPLAEMYGLTLLKFESGLELRAGPEKGDAVRTLLQETGRGKHPAAFLGDDFTDEGAFRAIEGRGLGVLVRREKRETAASVWLQPPEELRSFLAQWSRACRSLGAQRIPA
jgi:trehalose-phosphatase